MDFWAATSTHDHVSCNPLILLDDAGRPAGVTRGKKLVVVIGQPKALAMAVKNQKSTKRLTNLVARLGL